MSRICTICARAGSKGVPGKNTRLLLGKPLLAHSILQAQESDLFDAIAVSSESDDILSVAAEWGDVHLIRRPDEMANDTASKLPPIRHAALTVEEKTGVTFDVIVDLDVTSPLRNIDDIKGAVALLEARNVTNILTGAPARKNPYFNILERGSDGTIGLSKRLPGDRLERRQDTPDCFDANAAVYVWRRDDFVARPDVFYGDTLLYEMPEERSHDIDTPLDFEFVEFLMRKRDAR
ncbi:MAG: acylneuraminate cytidylyltransferase family protein [Rhodospirillaceae bacterium]|jgi:CMP-N,N'-diacetyllegionaminic acid synthase|nr:acylneuraminate cytidylyltransferase family protein [Rhodospirillaceae bacterium]